MVKFEDLEQRCFQQESSVHPVSNMRHAAAPQNAEPLFLVCFSLALRYNMILHPTPQMSRVNFALQ